MTYFPVTVNRIVRIKVYVDNFIDNSELQVLIHVNWLIPARRAGVERKISTFNCDKYNDPFKNLEKFEEWRMKVQTAARNVPSKSIRREELEQYLTRVVHSTLTIDNEYQVILRN